MCIYLHTCISYHIAYLGRKEGVPLQQTAPHLDRQVYSVRPIPIHISAPTYNDYVNTNNLYEYMYACIFTGLRWLSGIFSTTKSYISSDIKCMYTCVKTNTYTHIYVYTNICVCVYDVLSSTISYFRSNLSNMWEK